MREFFPTLSNWKVLLALPIVVVGCFVLLCLVLVLAAAKPGPFFGVLFVVGIVAFIVAAVRTAHNDQRNQQSLRAEGAINIFSVRPALVLFNNRIRTPEGDFALTPDLRASVETSGSLAVTQRLTVTRMFAFGIFSLAAPKKSTTDNRKLYVLLDGGSFQSVVEISPNKETAARKFAAQVTTHARQSLPPQRSFAPVAS